MNTDDPTPPGLCGVLRPHGRTVFICVREPHPTHQPDFHRCVNITRVDAATGAVSPVPDPDPILRTPE